MKRIVLCFCIVMLLCSCAKASTLTERERMVRAGVPSDAQDRLEQVQPGSSFAQGLKGILKTVLPSFNEAVRDALKSIAIMLSAMVLCAVAGGEEGMRAATVAGALSISAAGMAELDALAKSGEQAISEMLTFSDLLLPSMAASTAAAGGITASAAVYAGTAFFTDLLMRAMTGLLIPLLYAYLALCTAQTVCGHSLLERISDAIAWTFRSGLKTILFIFTAYLSITGLISGSADATVLKAAKLTLSGVVPVVGSMISDASETVIVGAQTVKNSIGAFGMLAVIAICIGPFVRICVRFLLLKLAGAAAGAIGPKPLLKLMDQVAEAMGFLLAMTGTAALMLLISCVCYLKVVPG